ncbi:MAG: hypothetical protein EBW12_06960 [Actinobacteria bacterium]|nr:hypothetical protein [Actinomycetota bacterium]
MWQDNNPGEATPQPQAFEIPVFMEQLNAKIAYLEQTIEEQIKLAGDNYMLATNLANSIRDFFEENREDDTISFNIDEANEFLNRNNITTLKRLYLVQFRIEGEIEVEAANEDEAQEAVDELDVSHYSADIKTFEIEARGVDSIF